MGKPYSFDREFVSKLAVRVKTMRRKKGVTQEVLANQSNVSLSQIARIETGKLNPTISTLHAIATALNTTLTILFDFTAKTFLSDDSVKAEKTT